MILAASGSPNFFLFHFLDHFWYMYNEIFFFPFRFGPTDIRNLYLRNDIRLDYSYIYIKNHISFNVISVGDNAVAS